MSYDQGSAASAPVHLKLENEMDNENDQRVVPKFNLKDYDPALLRGAVARMPDYCECKSCGHAWYDPCGGDESAKNLTCCPKCPADKCQKCDKTCSFAEPCIDNDGGLPRHERVEADPEKQTKHQASTDKILRSSKQCPAPFCGVWITKLYGCDFVYCPMCKFQFCWDCGVPRWKTNIDNRFAHEKNCWWRKHNYEPIYHSTSLEKEDMSLIMNKKYRFYGIRQSLGSGKIKLYDQTSADLDNPDYDDYDKFRKGASADDEDSPAEPDNTAMVQQKKKRRCSELDGKNKKVKPST
ncbi:MAG: hypothetical protein Q9159_004210 [Coniocarpon cinnabarinum]